MAFDIKELAARQPVLVFGVAGGVTLVGAWLVLGKGKQQPQTTPALGGSPQYFLSLPGSGGGGGGPLPPAPAPDPGPLPSLGLCPPGFFRPPGTSGCIRIPTSQTCPPGYSWNTDCNYGLGCCEPDSGPIPSPNPDPNHHVPGDCGDVTCAPGYHCALGNCVPDFPSGTCPPGYHMGRNGQCEPDGGGPTAGPIGDLGIPVGTSGIAAGRTGKIGAVYAIQGAKADMAMLGVGPK